MATKRRKMWAVVDDEGRGSQVFTSLKSARAWAAHELRDGTGWHVVPYIERLPGDVVLSREEVKRLATTVAEGLATAGYLWREDVPKVAALVESASLLRGRR